MTADKQIRTNKTKLKFKKFYTNNCYENLIIINCHVSDKPDNPQAHSGGEQQSLSVAVLHYPLHSFRHRFIINPSNYLTLFLRLQYNGKKKSKITQRVAVLLATNFY